VIDQPATSRKKPYKGPAIILVRPQMGENIGKAARAMLNFGLQDMRLVAPRDGWPNPAAVPVATGADIVLEKARVFATVAEAIADLQYVYATTARPRELLKEVVTPRRAGSDIRASLDDGVKVGVLFGPEAAGMTNDEIALAEAIISVPLNPKFKSLNLAQAVLLVAYECWQAGDETPESRLPAGKAVPASREELIGFFEHLEEELDKVGFLRPVEKRPSMVRNIRSMFERAHLMAHEVRTLRGIIKALTVYQRRNLK
jgi:tRNA/rRNA methyltransferase